VIVLGENDKKNIINDNKLMDDSSDFFSEHYENYVKDLHQAVRTNKIQLNERER
jgi:hypothetical protein